MLKVNNLQLNLIRKGIFRLRDCYRQSNDSNIRNSVKEMVFYELSEGVDGFMDLFYDKFNACKMDSLASVEDLAEDILKSLDVEKMPKIDMATAKKLFRKMQEKDLRSVVAGYNKAVESGNMSYYSQTIDNNRVFLYYDNGQFDGAVCSISRNDKGREIDCHFCHFFRRADDIEYVTKVEKGKKGNYTSRTVTCCSDHAMCNDAILSLEPLKDFLQTRRKENERDSNPTQYGE